MIKKGVILFFVFINLTAFGQWKSHYPEKKQNKKTTLSKEKKQDNNIYFNNLFFNAIKQKSFTKLTLGGCFIERINETILISRESVHKV